MGSFKKEQASSQRFQLKISEGRDLVKSNLDAAEYSPEEQKLVTSFENNQASRLRSQFKLSHGKDLVESNLDPAKYSPEDKKMVASYQASLQRNRLKRLKISQGKDLVESNHDAAKYSPEEQQLVTLFENTQRYKQPQRSNILKRDQNTVVIGKLAGKSTDEELCKRAIEIAAMVKFDEKYLKKVSGVRKQRKKWSTLYKGNQVGKVTMILADAIYRRFLVDKALQTDQEFRTETIQNATTGDNAPAPATGRRTKLKKSDFETHGYTPGCRSCSMLEYDGVARHGHNEICRKRMEDLLSQTTGIARKGTQSGRKRSSAQIS